MAHTHIHMHKNGHMKIYVFFPNFLPVCYCVYDSPHWLGRVLRNFFQIFFFAYSYSGYVCEQETYNIYVSRPAFRCVFHVCFSLLHAPATGGGGAWRPEPYGAGHFLDPWDRVDHGPSGYSERRSVWASGSRAVTPNAFPMGVPIIRESHADHCSQGGYTCIDSMVHWNEWRVGYGPLPPLGFKPRTPFGRMTACVWSAYGI